MPQNHTFSVLELFKKRYYVQRFLKKCATIISLTEADKKAFKNILPYTKLIQASYSYIYDYNEILFTNEKSHKILIGNSASYIYDYTCIVNSIKNHKGMDLTFMCSYGLNLYSDTYLKWKQGTNEALADNNVHYWEKNLSLTEYNKEIASYKVFIVPIHRQSGLGAITTALCAGVKCYLTGVNYDYFAHKGLIVHKIEELSSSSLDEILAWDNNNAKYNINLVRNVCGIDKSVSEWENIYLELNKYGQ